MFCVNCNSPYAAPYQSMAIPSPTVDPALPPACQTHVPSAMPQGVTPPLQPSPAAIATPLSTYNYVTQQPTQGIYGDQGANGNIVCGQRPLNSMQSQTMWNTPPPCAQTETKVAQNVGNYDFYQSQWSVLNPYTREPLPTLTALWSPSNIEFIKRTIECMLTQVFGFDIGIEDTPAFRQTISDVATDNPRWMYDVQNGLPLLNQTIINREFTVHQVAIRQQLLYEKYMIRNDRQRFMPYAQGDRTVKGETVNDPSSYSLNQPTPISYDCFLTQAGLWCKK